jgi:hypothetical protein
MQVIRVNYSALSMPSDPIVRRQLQVIKKIIQDETWLEGERRGRPVSPDDPAVRENVCGVVLRIGQNLREAFSAELAKHAESDPVPSAIDFRAA